MTLTMFDQLEQGTDEWLAARCGMLTASTIGKLITPTLKIADNDTSRSLIATLALERLTGEVEYVHPTWQMQRGTDDEPVARDVYATHHAPVREVGFMIRHEGGVKVGYSPDGLVGDDGLIEIKSRSRLVQMQSIMTGTVPNGNMAQIMTGLWVSGREWCDYVSYRDGMPLMVRRVHPDPIWFDVIERAAERFDAAVAEVTATYLTASAGMVPTVKQPEYEEIF